MNSKERVCAVLDRQVPDKVPVGLYLVDYDTIERIIGRETFVRNTIKTRLALAAGRRDEVVESYKQDVVDLYRKLDCVDLITFKDTFPLPPKDYTPERLRQTGDERYEDEHGRVWRASKAENAMLCMHDPTVKEEYTVEDFPLPSQPATIDPSCFEAFDHVVQALGNERFIAGPGEIIGITKPGSFNDGLAHYVTAPEVIHAANRRLLAEQNAREATYARTGTDGVFVEHDMAGANGPFISPQTFKETCYPYMSERIRRLKLQHGRVILHNCGCNIPLMNMFIEMGIDCYQSLQTTAGMEIGKLKSQFGKQLSFWGGISLEVLIAGTPEQVRAEVRTALERGKPGGGFILGPSHSIAFGTKYENFMTMLDEFVKRR